MPLSTTWEYQLERSGSVRELDKLSGGIKAGHRFVSAAESQETESVK
jgi:hypothetical protein